MKRGRKDPALFQFINHNSEMGKVERIPTGGMTVKDPEELYHSAHTFGSSQPHQHYLYQNPQNPFVFQLKNMHLSPEKKKSKQLEKLKSGHRRCSNACSEHKRKHQRCPPECNGRKKADNAQKPTQFIKTQVQMLPSKRKLEPQDEQGAKDISNLVTKFFQFGRQSEATDV